MNVLSLFDGISAGRLALQRAGIELGAYYRSEIDKYANKVAMNHYPDDVQLGDVTKWREWDIDWSSIDMLIGGSPCQGFSFAGKQAGTKAVLDGVECLVTDREIYMQLKSCGAEFLSQSHLFWEYVLILDHIRAYNPNVKFLLENVKMKKELLQMIDSAMGVKSVVINSALVSAQNRVRHYWCNWEITQPEDKGILLKDVLDDDVDLGFYLNKKSMDYMNRSSEKWSNGKRRMDIYCNYPDGKSLCLTANMHKGIPYGVTDVTTLTTNKGVGIKITGIQLDHKENSVVYRPASIVGRRLNERGVRDDYNKDVPITQCLQVKHNNEKMGCLTTVEKDCLISTEEPNRYPDAYNRNDLKYRKLTPTECARLQTFPDGWAESVVSNSQAYRQYGNSWTVDVIAHIFKELKNECI